MGGYREKNIGSIIVFGYVRNCTCWMWVQHYIE